MCAVTFGEKSKKLNKGDVIKFVGKVDPKFPQAFPKFNQDFEDGGFAILRFKIIENKCDFIIPMSQYGNITISGNNFPSNYYEDFDKEYLIIAKVDSIDPNYGMQFKSIMCSKNIDINDKESQREFFNEILTDRLLNNLFDKIDNPLKVIQEKDTEKLLEIDGLGEKYIKLLYKRFENQQAYMQAYIELSDYSISSNLIRKLVDKYGNPQIAIRKVKDNPYILANEVDGIGFTKADGIALNTGVRQDSVKRLQAYIEHILNEASQSGYSYIHSGVLLDSIDRELGCFDIDTIIDTVNKMRDEGILWGGKRGIIALDKMYKLEYNIKNELERILGGESNLNIDIQVADNVIKELEKKQGWEYTDKQKEGVYQTINEQISLITGLGGCVDSETEYFNGKEWKKICDYSEGEKVLQYNQHSGKQLIDPIEYHNHEIQDDEYMFEFHLSDKHSQILSNEHNMIIKVNSETIKVKPLEFIKLSNGIDFSETSIQLPYYDMKKEETYWIDIEETNIVTKGITFSKDYERKYCFTVPSGMLILRRNDNIFITGNSGKTSVADASLKALGNHRNASCCLSGKAAARLKKVSGRDTSTIHRLLKYNPSGWDIEQIDGSTIKKYYIYDKDNKLPVDSVLLDEYSMLDGALGYRLFQAIPTGAKLILLGDAGQLGAIGTSNIAKDLLESDKIPTCYLDKIHRQAAKSGIKVQSINVYHGEQLFDSKFTGEKVYGELEDFKINIFKVSRKDKKPTADMVMEEFKYQYDQYNQNIDDVQVIVPTKKGGDASVYDLNNRIQKYVNPKKNDSEIEVQCFLDKEEKYPFKLRIGDKVINKRNNYLTMEVERGEWGWNVISKPQFDTKKGVRDKTKNPDAVFNGFTGELKDVKFNDLGQPTSLIIYFYDIDKYIEVPNSHWESIRGISLAYAIGLYKSQGSEYKCVILGIDNVSYKLLSRELLYVGISRGQEHVTLIGENSAIRHAINVSKTQEKQTFLKPLLDGKELELE